MSIYDQQLENFEKNYDPQEHMVRFYTEGHEYHSGMKGWAHETNQSTTYAALLLRTGGDAKRADDLIRKVLTLQCRDENSLCYGVWPWYLEEPLDRMDPPDLNFAAFIGRNLIYCVQYGYPKEVVRDALEAASHGIMRRHVQPGYMNICLMSCMVCLCTGGLYGNEEILNYGKKMLREFADYGYFTEYNSHRYMGIASQILAGIYRLVPDEEVKDLCRALSDQVWRIWALHYHPETRQLCGPYTRAYFTYLPEGDRNTLLNGVSMDDEEYKKYGWLPCPEEYRHYFEKTEEPRFVQEQYAPDVDPAGPENFQRGGVAMSYLSPSFCVGSFRESDMWSQRRTVLAFWGGAENPRCFTVRCYHDGLHFCGAVIRSEQEKGRVHSRIQFNPDGFDTHCNLDPIHDGRIRAQDLRVVFEFHNTEPVGLDIRKAMFDGQEIAPVKTEQGIEIPLYHGEEKTFDLRNLGETLVDFVFELKEGDCK